MLCNHSLLGCSVRFWGGSGNSHSLELESGLGLFPHFFFIIENVREAFVICSL